MRASVIAMWVKGSVLALSFAYVTTKTQAYTTHLNDIKIEQLQHTLETLKQAQKVQAPAPDVAAILTVAPDMGAKPAADCPKPKRLPPVVKTIEAPATGVCGFLAGLTK